MNLKKFTMKIQFMLLVLLLSTSVITLAQKSFKKISVDGSMDIRITQRDGKLTVSSDNDDFLVSESDNTITIMNGVGDGKSVTILTDQLEEISVGGSINVKEISELKFSNIKIDLLGSCDAPIRLECNTLKLFLGGTSDLTLSGSATSADVTINGSNDFDAKNFIVNAANLKITGSNDVWINAKKSLKINASGACTVNYKCYLVATKPKKKYLPAVSKKLTGACVVKSY
jgi:Putative auto-transporter adhesin, head GIN domain